MEILIWGCVFIISLFFLLKSADWFTDSAKELGLVLGISPFIVGITIVALGTSIPELATGISSVIHNANDVVISNALGSNVANILLVLGVAALMKKDMKFKNKIPNSDLIALFGSGILLTTLILLNIVSKITSLVLVLGYVIYVGNIVLTHTKEKKKKNKEKFNLKDLGILLVSSILIYFSSEYLIRSLIKVSEISGIGTSVIAISAVAIGTSLPELIVSVKAALKNEIEMSIGNVIGSNIFNTLMVVGIPGLIQNLAIASAVKLIVLPAFIIANIIVFYVLKRKQISRANASFMLALYTIVMIVLFTVKV